MPAMEPPPGQIHAFTRKPLSCTNCRERKVKCDRASPCVPCRKNGLECVFPARRVRARKDRGLTLQSVGTTQLGNTQLEKDDLDRIAGKSESTSHLVSHTLSRSSSFLFSQPNDDSPFQILHPSIAHMKVLYDVYFANVDPVCKILHRSTANRRLLYMETLPDLPSRRLQSESLDAAAFAMYFAAVNSLSSENCITLFSEKKTSLLERYRHSLQELLVRANFLSTSDIATLQALSIYIVSFCCCWYQAPYSEDSTQSSYYGGTTCCAISQSDRAC